MLLQLLVAGSFGHLRQLVKTLGARLGLALLALLAGALTGRAQWLTQTNVIKPGWSAVYFYVDASSQTLDNLVGFNPACPIDQIWLWKTLPTTAQYLSSPATPFASSGQWLTYYAPSLGTASTLSELVPNAACLVHSTAATNYTWTVKGQPVPPGYVWDDTGLNFIGFQTPYANPPTFQNFLAQNPPLAGGVQIYQYVGGAFSAQNPAQLFTLYTTPVTRGQAFWVSNTNINNTYFGPFNVNLPNPAGLNFGATLGQFTVHLVNVTSNALTVSARLLPSETPPYGQTNIVGVPPLLVEGALNSSNLTYAYTTLAVGVTNSWTLAPAGQSGSDVAVVLGVNRFALTNTTPGIYAGILQFGDSLGFSEVDVPVSASAASNAGLWVGAASISQVGSYLKSYATNADGSFVVSAVTNQIYATNYLPFATTNLIINNALNTNLALSFYNLTNLVVNAYTSTNFALATNAYVLATNLVVNTVVVTNVVLVSTVTNYAFIGTNVVFYSAVATNISSTVSATTNAVVGTNQLAGGIANNAPVVLTNLIVNYVAATNVVVTNGPFMGPVTNQMAAFQILTNYWITTNLASAIISTNPMLVTTVSSFVTGTNYWTTNLSATILLSTNYVATNTALVIITNGPSEIVLNPLINNYAVLVQTNFAYNTNYNVISNLFLLGAGFTNYLGSTTNQLSASSFTTNFTTSTNFTLTALGITTNALYNLTTNLLVMGYSNYVVTAINTSLGAVPAPYPLRLILFNDGTNVSLLQRVYYGLRQNTNIVVATTERVLDVAHLNTARRITATHMPWTAANQPWPFTGQLNLGGVLTTTVFEPYDDQAANPFLHTYHPDHNNLATTASPLIPPPELPKGSESYDISRQITLQVLPNTDDFITLTTANSTLTGSYLETISLIGLQGTRNFTTAGTFTLTRISPIATLTTQ